MVKLKSYRLFRPMVLYFLVLYVLGTISNMVFIPRYSQSFSCKIGIAMMAEKMHVPHNHFSELNLLKVIDKSTLENDQQESLLYIPVFLLLLVAGFCLFPFIFRPVLFRLLLFGNQRRAYLNYCTFRI